VTAGDNTFTYGTADGGEATVAGFAAQPGWDAASGLGSPAADVLVPALAAGEGD